MNCSYQKGLPHPCGKPAVAAIKIKATEFVFEAAPDGFVLGSEWMPVCYEHMQMFPDYDGIHLTTA